MIRTHGSVGGRGLRPSYPIRSSVLHTPGLLRSARKDGIQVLWEKRSNLAPSKPVGEGSNRKEFESRNHLK